MDTARHNDPTLVWAPRRQLTLSQARQRSETVVQLRRLFIAAAAISMGFFVGHILKSAISGDARAPALAEDSPAMVNPRFTGRDTAGNVFTIIAASAERPRALAGIIDLAGPVLRDFAGSEVRAPNGRYDRDAGILELYGEVSIKEASGYAFKTRGAKVYVRENRVEGLSPLIGNGPLGDIRSDTYQILDGGNRVVLEGNVNTVIYPDPRPAPQAAPETDERPENAKP